MSANGRRRARGVAYSDTRLLCQAQDFKVQAGAIQACSVSRTTSTNSVVQQSLDFSRTHVTSYEFVMPAIRGARDLDANRPKAFMSTKCTHFRTPGRGAPHSEHVDGKRMQMCKLSRRGVLLRCPCSKFEEAHRACDDRRGRPQTNRKRSTECRDAASNAFVWLQDSGVLTAPRSDTLPR